MKNSASVPTVSMCPSYVGADQNKTPVYNFCQLASLAAFQDLLQMPKSSEHAEYTSKQNGNIPSKGNKAS